MQGLVLGWTARTTTHKGQSYSLRQLGRKAKHVSFHQIRPKAANEIAKRQVQCLVLLEASGPNA